MQKERAVVQEHQGRNEGSQTRDAAGIKQGCGRNAANMTGGRYLRGAQHEISRAATGTRQKPQGGAAGIQQETMKEFGRALAGMQRKRHGPQKESRNSEGQ